MLVAAFAFDAFAFAAFACAAAVPFPAGFKVEGNGGASLNGVVDVCSNWAGPHGGSLTPSADPAHPGWHTFSLDDSREADGLVIVRAATALFSLERRYVATASRILVNDTLTCDAARSARCALYTNHTFTLRAPATVRLNGGFDAPQLSECATNVVRGTNGNPSVVAAHAAGGGFGVMLLDDISRAHGYMVNRATPTARAGLKCAISDPPAFDVLDTYLALSPAQQYTAEWAIYVIESSIPEAGVPWAFTNRLRADLGVNAVTLRGGGTLASWETEILLAGNWTDPGCEGGDIHSQGAVCFPTWPDATLREFLEYQGSGVISSNIMRMETAWKKCEPPHQTRDYCYGSCGTAKQYSNWTDTYLRRLVSSLKRVNYKGKAILYLHPFISTEAGAATKYANDRQLTADGTQTCDYAGEFIGTTENQYGKQLLEFVALAMDDFGFDGLFLDESTYGVTPLDYSPFRSDGHSAIIDPATFEITANVSFVPLTYMGLHAAIYDEVVSKRGGFMVANGFPSTRTVMQAGIRNGVVSIVETSAKGREIWGHTYTPVGLAKALFQTGDPDPRYANVSGLPVDNLWADLDFGTLTYMYDMLLSNVSGWQGKQNVMQFIYPTTPTELGPGFIVGEERVVTKAAGEFTLPGAPPKLTVRTFNRQGYLTASREAAGPTVRVDAGGTTAAFAVITPSAAGGGA